MELKYISQFSFYERFFMLCFPELPLSSPKHSGGLVNLNKKIAAGTKIV